MLGEIRTENFDTVRPYAFYLRIRPWTDRDFDIQIGRVPPTFGAFARRTYANDNPLIGYPLAYQYPTTLRPDAVPASADELLSKRSSGWLLRYSLGDPSFAQGVPLVSAFRWDTGVQAHAKAGMLSATAAITAGTVSNPLFSDDNQGRQLAGRLELRPVPGLILGTSLARGPFIGQAAARAAVGDGHDSEFTQTAWGADAEYSRDHYLLRLEEIVSEWRMPGAQPPADQTALRVPISAISTSIEGRYKVRPDLVCRGALRSSRVQRCHGDRRDAAVGRAGDPLRSGPRLLDPAQSAAEGILPARTTATAGGCCSSRTCSRANWCIGSDEDVPPRLCVLDGLCVLGAGAMHRQRGPEVSGAESRCVAPRPRSSAGPASPSSARRPAATCRICCGRWSISNRRRAARSRAAKAVTR